MRQSRLTRRVAFGLVSAAFAAALSLCGTFYYRLYRANAAVQSVSLPEEPPPNARFRVLVVAPHCDDEILGAGGYMAMAARRGAHVRVVMLTNGDGFPLAATREYRRIPPSAETFLRFAALRQGETRAALEALGLSRNDVTFLGYPDGGLSHLWSRHWGRLSPRRLRGAQHHPIRTATTRARPMTARTCCAISPRS